MESEIQINNTAGVCQIDIEGTIGVPEEWQFEEPDARVATYERFRDTLRRIAEIEAPEVVVNIRSTGGDVTPTAKAARRSRRSIRKSCAAWSGLRC